MRHGLLALFLILAAGPAAAQGLCEGGLFDGGIAGFVSSLRGIVLIAIVVGCLIWGWWGLAMCIVVAHSILFLLPGLTGSAKGQGIDLSIYWNVMGRCATWDFLFILAIVALAALFLRDGFTRVRKPR